MSYEGPRFLNADEKIDEPQKVVPDHVVCLIRPIPVYATEKPIRCYKNKCKFFGRAFEVENHVIEIHRCRYRCTFCPRLYKSWRLCSLHMRICRGLTITQRGH